MHLIHLEIENVVREVETADEMLLRHAPWSDRSTTTILNKGGLRGPLCYRDSILLALSLSGRSRSVRWCASSGVGTVGISAFPG